MNVGPCSLLQRDTLPTCLTWSGCAHLSPEKQPRGASGLETWFKAVPEA